MNRGDHFESIFREAKDREIFLKTLNETCCSAGWVIHSFIFMGNHYHLLVETPRSNLVKGMQYLNSTYTQRFNNRHKLRGHLFQGRYKALLVDGEAAGYFLAVSDYIHLNPFRSHQIREPAELWKNPWSSAGWLSGMRKGCPKWLRWERVYGELGLRDWKSRSRREYRRYLEGRVEEIRQDSHNQDRQQWGKIRRGWCLGSEGFVTRMKEKLEELSTKNREDESWAGEAVEELEEELANRVLKRGLRCLSQRSIKDLSVMERDLLGYWLRNQTKVSMRWIAQTLGVRSVPGMRSCISRMARKINEDKEALSLWKKLQLQHISD